MEELVNEIEKLNEEEQERILAEVSTISLAIIDVLDKYAKKETVVTVQDSGNRKTETRNTIQQSKLRGIIAELDRLEQRLYKALYSGTVSAMSAAIDETVAYLRDSYDIDVDAKLDADKTLGKGVTIGDKTLQQRTQGVASELSDDIRKVIRQGVYAGDDVGEIITTLRKTFKDIDWKIVRIIESEIYSAYRYQFGTTASENGYDWIRIHESFPRHPRRKKHKCYPLANTDKYGKGKGVYKSTDTEIYFPHPQCTSWLEVVEVLD